MTTVKTRDFKHTAKSGETFQFKAPITVDARGMFTVNLPDELVVTAQAYLKQPKWNGHVTLDQARVNWRVQARVLDEVECFIVDVIAEHLAVEVTKELVIRYRYENNTAGARSADGSLHPDGHWAAKEGERTDTKSWEWAGNQNIHATNRPSLFGVGVVAVVYQKVTYKRPSGSRVEYTYDLPGSHWDRNPMRRLNSFIVDRPDTRSAYRGIMTNGRSPSDEVFEIPYSDAAAIFFSDLMVAMLRLGEQMDAFVGDRNNLQIAIDKGFNLLAAPTQAVNATH